jgi:thiosulfate/3-mercaptopyruvate sulfurtransferase
MVVRLGLFLSLIAALGNQALAAEEKYPRGGLLVEPSRLADEIKIKRPIASPFGPSIILDARERKQYDEGRIPGAIWVDTAAWEKTFDDGKDAAAWSARIGSLGIDRCRRVVVYDNNSFKDAARVWWILRYWGVSSVQLLNGNWTTWKKEGFPIETGKPKPPVANEFVAVAEAERLATKAQVLASLKDKSLQIVDARTENEFCGTDKLKNKRAGAIPGAKHLEWTDLIVKETQRFKSPEQLRKFFQEAGIDLKKRTAAHCQSGGRASVMAFAMELMGADDVANYYASWGEWGNADDTPIVVQEKPKK